MTDTERERAEAAWADWSSSPYVYEVTSEMKVAFMAGWLAAKAHARGGAQDGDALRKLFTWWWINDDVDDSQFFNESMRSDKRLADMVSAALTERPGHE